MEAARIMRPQYVDLIQRHCDSILSQLIDHTAESKTDNKNGNRATGQPIRGKSLLIAIFGEDCSGKTSFLKFLSYHPKIQSKFPLNRRLWYNLGDITAPDGDNIDLIQRNDIHKILDWIGCQISKEFNYNENFYRPDSIEEWIFYLKDLCHLQEWLLLLDNVPHVSNQSSLLNILHETGVNIIYTSSPFSSASLSKMTTFQLHDFTSEELSCYVETYRQIHQVPFPLTSNFARLLHDLSTSPLDIRILLSLISNYYKKISESSKTTVITEEFDEFLLQLYNKRRDIAVFSQEELVRQLHPSEIPEHSPEGDPLALHYLRILMANLTVPLVSKSHSTDFRFSECQLRRTSIVMSSQIALSSLPDHVQAKFILLCVLPKYQPTSLAFLSHLWQCSVQIAFETSLSLSSVDLLQFHTSSSSRDLCHEMMATDLLLVSFHSIHYDYLDSLIRSSTIWITRVQLAITRTREYLTHPRCIITDEKHSALDLETSSRLPLDEFFFPPPQKSTEFARLGLFWRRLMELHAHCDPTSPPLSKSLLRTALGDVIQSLDLSLCDISVVVRYLKSCISLMNDLDEDQVHHSSSLDASSSISLLPSPQTCCISDWYQLLLSLMEQDTQTTHSDIALYNIFYSTYLFKAKYFYASKKFLLKSLEIYQHIYTYDHRAVSTILSKLSLVSQELGNVQEAMKFLQESLEIKSSLFGSKHPLVGWDMNRLACMLSSQKEYSNAMFYHIAAIQSFQISFGDSQLDTIHAYGNLGLTLIAQGDTKRGMHILQDILFRFFQAGIPLGHPWIQRYTSYLKILNFHNTHGHGSDPRAQAQDSQETRQENHLELLSLERVSSPEITPSLFASIDTPAHHDSQTSFSNSSHHSPVPVQGAVDESFHVFLTLFSQQLKEGEGLQNTKQSYSHEQQKSSSHPHILTDENRFPDAALVLTE